MNNSGISDDKWDLYINNEKIIGYNNTDTKYFGESISVKVSIRYNWDMLKNFTKSTKEYEKTSTRYSKSSLIERKDSIKTEFKSH